MDFNTAPPEKQDAPPTVEAIIYLMHHVVLPRKLPQANDYNVSHEQLLLKTSLQALNDLKAVVRDEHLGDVNSAIAAIDMSMRSRDCEGNISEVQLQGLLSELTQAKQGYILPLEVRAQNAGILISRAADEVIFEFFELAPLNEASMLSGRLIRTFPGLAASIALAKFREDDLLQSLSRTISKMSRQAAPGFQRQTRKAGSSHDETRDTTNPDLVTDYLMNIVTAVGRTYQASRITKNTREEVMWKDKQLPWHRSPLWLFIRVTLQLHFTRTCSRFKSPDSLYKIFMALLITRIVNLATPHLEHMDSDLVHAAVSKLLWRYNKIESMDQFEGLRLTWAKPILDAFRNAHDKMSSLWNSITQEHSAGILLDKLGLLRPENDIDLNLLSLDKHLTDIAGREPVSPNGSFKPTSTYKEFPAKDLPQDPKASPDGNFFCLLAVEKWVEDHLQSWIETHGQDSITCGALLNLVTSYHSAAKVAYKRAPARMSVMYLTLLELWVACDKSACRNFPILCNYGPGIDLGSAQCLLLPFKSQMIRLADVESYLARRIEYVREDGPLADQSFGHKSSFAVQYFEQSPHLQAAKLQIEQEAAVNRQKKLEEFTQLKVRYQSIVRRYEAMTCNEVRYRRAYRHISHRCERCQTMSTADSLHITVFEWPLSLDPAIAKATVFETFIPKAFAAWRDTSAYVAQDVLGFRGEINDTPSIDYTLEGHPGLSKSLPKQYSKQRIIPLSEVKPHRGTHFNIKEHMSTLSEQDLCPQNGLKYRYYDRIRGAFTEVLNSTEEVAQMCTYKLPGPSKQLERYLHKRPSAPDGTPPNEVVASLSDCPRDFSLDEFKAFGTLISGHKLLYSNILLQLAMPSLDFAKVETHCLMLQALSQTGLSANGLIERTSHAILTDTSFCRSLLSQLNTAYERVSENWESWRASATFVQIACRVLTLTPSADIVQRCLDFLSSVRRTCQSWLSALKQRSACSDNDAERTELCSRATEISLLCTTTFDIEEKYLYDILQPPQAISTLLQCSVKIQENQNLISKTEHLFTSLSSSWRVLLYRLSRKLRQIISIDGTELNNVVLDSWAGFQARSVVAWTALAQPHEQWVCTTSGSLPVHFNLLTAELLVNGLPLSRLPSAYMAHALYKPLFGGCNLEVGPSEEPGMCFSSKYTFQDHQLHFGMNGPDMSIASVKGTSKYHLLPSKVFLGCLPEFFVSNHYFWYDQGDNTVILQPKDRPWLFSTTRTQWRLHRVGSCWQLLQGKDALLNMTSKSARVMATIFQPLEDFTYIHNVFDQAAQRIEIRLPRLDLDFFTSVGDTKIYSRQHRGLVLDADQGIGTLIGLSSRMVLCNEHRAHERLLLIPEGTVEHTRYGKYGHVLVTIRKGTSKKVHTYNIDHILQRLVDTGNLQCKLLLAYLHALTSSNMPDSFTGQTGTERALELLHPAAVMSFGPLTSANIETLFMIAKLSPARHFYPHYLREMQMISWNHDLPSTSQHGLFSTYVKDVFDQARKEKVLYQNASFAEPSKEQMEWLSSESRIFLQDRDASRSAYVRASDSGGNAFTSERDTVYIARDLVTASDSGQRAFVAASTILRDESTLPSPIRSLNDSLLSSYFGHATVKGPAVALEPSELRYDSQWLESFSAILQNRWCKLHKLFAEPAAKFNTFDVMTWLSTMAFQKSIKIDAILALGTLFKQPDITSQLPPSVDEFLMNRGATFCSETIRSMIERGEKNISAVPDFSCSKIVTETDDQHKERTLQLFNAARSKAVKKLMVALEAQWPCPSPVMPHSADITDFISVSNLSGSIRAQFKIWFDNRDFKRYLTQVSQAIEHQQTSAVIVPVRNVIAPQKKYGVKDEGRHIGMQVVFAEDPAMLDDFKDQAPHVPRLPRTINANLNLATTMMSRLDDLCSALDSQAVSECDKIYVENLRISCRALENRECNQQIQAAATSTRTQEIFGTHLIDCNAFFAEFNAALYETLTSKPTSAHSIAFRVQLGPRVSPTFWLRYLSKNKYDRLPRQWQKLMIAYGCAVTHTQRAQRLNDLSSKPVELAEEHRHRGHINWDPEEFPETLLLEAESGILVRKEQEAIAGHMRNPEHGKNAVVQLVMGGGKSSTIVPIVAAHLADEQKLVRIIVGKPQSKQMLHTLISKLSGLLGRRIYQMPFSRDLRLSQEDADAIRAYCKDCIDRRGIMLVQPEHLLSFKLMGVESHAIGKSKVGASLCNTQAFFDHVARDIVDESDENFSPRFELVYTMGSQRSIEFSPDRWVIIQEILGHIPKIAAQIKAELPVSIHLHHGGQGRFPRIRILRHDASERLSTLLAEQILEQGIVGLPVRSQSPTLKKLIFRYITSLRLDTEEINGVEGSSFWSENTMQPLLLLRGLIAGGMLAFAFGSKRWRVNYGLDTARVPATKTAVPYRSKDSPSLRSEFSHPDVVIILTCLSYYYESLSDDYLFEAFEHVLKSEQAAIQYSEWVAHASSELPTPFRHLSGISIKDRILCITKIFPALRFSKGVIDYYLSHFCFKKELKEFPLKLSASGWDLGAEKTQPTVGFSGTNDTMHVLPLGVKQLDLVTQRHTNAEVLGHLLQEETSIEPMLPVTDINVSDAERLLQQIEHGRGRTIRVLLDVGAQVLDLSNKEVAAAWLRTNQREDVGAVVFFEEEELSVLDRAGRTESFQTSPFAKQLSQCLVYLDEAHTRGTDLKLPRDYRAAVTLGAGLTKDRLAQACMRLRQLGKGQSVCFMIPEDIQMRILERNKKPFGSQIEVEDIICWTIGETWDDLRRSMPLWAVQGHRFETQKSLLSSGINTKAQAESFLEVEAQTLEVRYRPQAETATQFADWDETNGNIAKIITQCRNFQAPGLSIASLSEEQERELSPEIQQERQVERPPKVKPTEHELHADVKKLALTGTLKASSNVFEGAFESLRRTSAAKLYDINAFPSDLLVTADFKRTVLTPGRSDMLDPYLRPVQFVISIPGSGRTKSIKQLVLVSPYEANLLLPIIGKSNKVTLHLFAPRHNSGFASLDKLDLWNVGKKFVASSLTQDLKLQLNLFSGSLYFDSCQGYSHLCGALGLLQTTATAEQEVTACGFIKPPTGTWGLTKSPVPFLRALVLKIRREGDGIEKTHIGKVLSALPLTESDFEHESRRLREITSEVVAEFEQHTGSRRSRPFDPEDPDSLFMSE